MRALLRLIGGRREFFDRDLEAIGTPSHTSFRAEILHREVPPERTPRSIGQEGLAEVHSNLRVTRMVGALKALPPSGRHVGFRLLGNQFTGLRLTACFT